MCGGDALANQKKKEADSQINLNNTMSNIASTRNSAQQPFLTDRMKNGLPYFNDLVDYNNGTLARSLAPQRAALNRNFAGFGDTLPSGFKTQAMTDFNASAGRQFDDSLVGALGQNEATKENAAAQLNPLGFFQGASGAANSVLSAPAVQSGGMGNFLGGMASSLLQAGGAAGGFGKLFSL